MLSIEQNVLSTFFYSTSHTKKNCISLIFNQCKKHSVGLFSWEREYDDDDDEDKDEGGKLLQLKIRSHYVVQSGLGFTIHLPKAGSKS